MLDINTLPQWQCHKIVKAAPIKSCAINHVDIKNNITYYKVVLDIDRDSSNNNMIVNETIFSRYIPNVGDYFVIYDDGYQSLSPKKVFEEGYSLLDLSIKQE